MSRRPPAPKVAADASWLEDAVLYELSVRAFFDGDGDGRGDFKGLLEKLDYVQGLGVTAVWLQPFYPSPWRDDGYDVADLAGVHPECGTLADFKAFVAAAHARRLRVVTELVLNHTSDQHPAFQRERRATRRGPGGGLYVWSRSPERYAEARVIFAEEERSNWAWDPVRGRYYWHRFYSHEPDLDWESPAALEAVTAALDFWLDLGVDGVRLDALPYLFEREGTACENLPETHEVVRRLRRHVDARFPGRVLLTEATLWPEEAAAYFGASDECQVVFHTSLAPRLLMAVRMEDRHPVVDILEQTPPPPPGAHWALFLRNHDELTLEPLTEEERDYMYRAYAADPEARVHHGIRRRLAPMLGNDRRRLELANALLLSLPGAPVLYYGDEIGMGDNLHLGGRRSVRTPMQWTADRNAGFSPADPERLYLPPVSDAGFSYEAVNVQRQEADPQSLLRWTRQMIGLRRRLAPLARGSLELLAPSNRKVLAFLRARGEEQVLVVANLSRFVQPVSLDLSRFRGRIPREALGRAELPIVEEAPYSLTLGPHGFYWLALERPSVAVVAEEAAPLASLQTTGSWTDLFAEEPGRTALAEALPAYLRGRRWFAGKARSIRQVELPDTVPLPTEAGPVFLTLVRVEFAEGEPEVYAVPLAFAAGERAFHVGRSQPGAVVAHLTAAEGAGVLYGAEGEPGFGRALLDAIQRRRRFRGRAGAVLAGRTRAFASLCGPTPQALAPAPLGAEQSNSSIRFGDRAVLKLYRRVAEGRNPELEIGELLTARGSFRNTPPLAGYLEYRPHRGESRTLALLQGFVANEGDAWRYTLDQVGRYFRRVAGLDAERRVAPFATPPPLDLAPTPFTPLAEDLLAPFADAARLLGRRTAELHVALAADRSHPDFAPEPFSSSDQRALYQSLRNLVEATFSLLERRLPDLPEDAREEGRRVLEQRPLVLRGFRFLLDRRLSGLRTRIHGDYHLGQVLWTGKDFVIIDFEGEPARPIAARRVKRSPLVDVAGMIRSFHYAAHQGLADHLARGGLEDPASLRRWAEFWYLWAASSYLGAYLERGKGAAFLPRRDDEREGLLRLHLMEKAVYELAYELDNRPGWAGLPLRGLSRLLGEER
jgi:maltose alpha-D-glucosyltransferase/alpha-amylase